MSTGFYLLDHPNPNGPFYYTTRRRRLVAITVHCTAGLEDLDLIGPDHSAEKTAQYAATTTRAVSWHSGSDTDSCFELLPAHYTAFQTRGYNSSTYGHEISKRDMTWSDEPPAWVTATLERPKDHLRRVAVAAGIPIRRITQAELDRAIAADDPSLGGFIGHAPLDPTRRTDPGADFPWERFLALVEGDEMVDRNTKADDGLGTLAAVFDEALDRGFASEHTQPGGVAFNDEILAMLKRMGLFDYRTTIAAMNKKIAAAAAGGATIGAVIAEIVERLAN